jgi:hypothetical protein
MVVGLVVGLVVLVVAAVVAFRRFRHKEGVAPSDQVVDTRPRRWRIFMRRDPQHMTFAEVQAVIAKLEAKAGTSDDKFSATTLLLGNSKDSDLRPLIGLDSNDVFGASMRDPFEAMKNEWHEHGTEEDKANWRYVVEGIACDPEWIPRHVQESEKACNKAAEFDIGHKGWKLQQFLELDASKKAGLKKEHVIALRLYSSSSFGLFNKAMREKTNPHPIRVSVYVLHEALKKLRKVDAEENPDEYNQVKVLYRGMKDMKLNFAEFAKKGGTEVSDCREHIVVAHSLSVSAS